MNFDSIFNPKFIQEAQKVGLTLLGEGRNANFRTYRFNDCGHEQQITVRNVRINVFECKECHKSKLREEATLQGLETISVTEDRGVHLFRFKECGHEQKITLQAVRNNQFKCRTCHQIKLEKEANLVGLELKGKGRNGYWRTYVFKECGHVQEIQKSNVRNNNFVCNACEETSWSLPSKVYLLEIKHASFEWIKLGYAKNIKSRIYRYRLPEKVKIKELKVVTFETGKEAYDFESSLHKKYKNKRLPIKTMKEFHQTGFKECYPKDMKEILIKELSF